MGRTYLDASALAKRYILEPGSRRVLEQCAAASEILLSVLCLPEIISAFNRLVREKKINKVQYRQLKTSVVMDAEQATVLEVSYPILQRTVQCLESSPLRTLDAVHIATAVEAACDLFVTADRRQAKAASKLGLAVSEIH